MYWSIILEKVKCFNPLFLSNQMYSKWPDWLAENLEPVRNQISVIINRTVKEIAAMWLQKKTGYPGGSTSLYSLPH